MAEVYAASDHHLQHRLMLRAGDHGGRPFSNIDEHDQTLIDNHNATVLRDEDWAIFFGDVTLGDRGRGLERVRQMRGRKFLVIGNHEKCFPGTSEGHRHMRQYLETFEWALPHLRFKLPPAVLPGDDPRGREDRPGRKVWFSHFPYDGDSHGDDRHTGSRLRDEGVALVHGHVHDEYTVRRSKASGAIQVNVGVDVWDYTPVNLKAVAALIDSVEAHETEEF